MKGPIEFVTGKLGADLFDRIKQEEDHEQLHSTRNISLITASTFGCAALFAAGVAMTSNIVDIEHSGENKVAAVAAESLELSINKGPGAIGAVLSGLVLAESLKIHRRSTERLEELNITVGV